MLDRELAAMEALGKIEEDVQAVKLLNERLGKAPLWQPGPVLAKQAAHALELIGRLQARMDRRLVVTLIGPSGAGKSTLLNALAGVDDLSPTGTRRPTTQSLVVLSNDPATARQLLGPMDENLIQLRSSPKAELLTHVVLVDTPDTDSTERERHLPLIEQAVEHSDLLICVFDAQNPKRRDHADFMAPIVRRFHGASLVAVVNQCDRLSPEELSEVVGPDFDAYLQEAWDVRPEAVLMVSARQHLQHPRWDPQAGPRHDLDQFDQLRRFVFETFNRAGFGPDRRLANSRQIKTYLFEQVDRAVARDRAALEQAAERITVVEQEALRQAVTSLRREDLRMVLGVNARLYQSLAQRWMGPVGWLVAIWSRIILFGTGLAALIRFGNPLRQIWGLISSWRHYRESSAAIGSLDDQTRIDQALQTFQKVWWTHWPDIAELLIQGRFDPEVRRVNVDQDKAVGDLVRGLWRDSLDTEIERSAASLSHFLLQILFNLPSLALLAYIGWLTASHFWAGTYLGTDFFLHALLTLAAVLLLSFFIYQLCLRLAVSRDRIQRRAFQAMEQRADDSPLLAGREMTDQVARVLALARK